MSDEHTSTADGFDAQAFLKTVSEGPGIYRMFDDTDTVIYVGKARNLKKRLASYFRRNLPDAKTRVLVSHIRRIETTLTNTETEALLLESNLIKSLKPRYNIIYRDDKSYPWIYLSSHQPFPRLGFYRGARREQGRFFGPYPSSASVRETLRLLQKIFPVRQCEDSFYRNRSRPCLQHQIKRCTAPCVGLISEADYAEDVRMATLFLEGKSDAAIRMLVSRMEAAAEARAYEQAAVLRDQIAALRRVQETQYIDSRQGDVDVLAAAAVGGVGCVQLFTIRGGRNLGNRAYFPSHGRDTSAVELLDAFVVQHYLGERGGAFIPDEILLSHAGEDSELVAAALSERKGRKVRLRVPRRGERRQWLGLALRNAEHAATSRLNSRATLMQRFLALQDALGLEEMPQRLECFDISHTMGEATVASCVVFDPNGPLKSDYRRYNIRDITPGDDYAAMRQALTRRFRKGAAEGKLPDVLFIDGGKGQLNAAREVLDELQLGEVLTVGVAKGPGRKPGLETLHLVPAGEGDAEEGGLSTFRAPFILPPDSPALHLVQQVRDEAHRFAITGHRQRRQKARNRSPLEDIPGLGPKRRQALLRQFGGLQEVSRAGIEDLCRIDGISRQLAERIYDTFHADGT